MIQSYIYDTECKMTESLDIKADVTEFEYINFVICSLTL